MEKSAGKKIKESKVNLPSDCKENHGQLNLVK